jgi:excisionase family DNA binding protein
MPVQIGDMMLYNVQDLAEMLETSESTIRRCLRDGTLTGKKMGRRWYVADDSLQEYFRAMGIRQEPAEAPPEAPPAPEPLEDAPQEQPVRQPSETTAREPADWQTEVEELRRKAEELKREAERIEQLYAPTTDEDSQEDHA